MKKLLLAIPFLGFMLLGAHFFRQGEMGLAASCVLLAGLLFGRAAWMRYVAGAVLLAGALVWVDAGLEFVRIRQLMGLEWTRLAAIMAGVLLFDLAGVAVLASGFAENEFFTRATRHAAPRAAMFVLTATALAVARMKVPFAVLLADRYLPGFGWLEITLLALYASWVGGLMLEPHGHRALRPRIWAMFSAVFFLQLTLGLLGMDRMLMTGILHLPVPALIVGGPVFRGAGLFMIILFSATILLVGPAWCSHLCYIGAWDDFLSRRGPRPAPNGRLGRYAVLGRAWTLVLVVGTALILRLAGVSSLTAVWLAAGFGLAGVGVMVLVSRKVGIMAHCTIYCPMGLLANVFGRISPWRMRINADCTRCGVCFTRCRFNALDGDRLDAGSPGISCTLCGDCVSACAHGQINFHFPGLSGSRARTVFLVLIVSLHALFLGVARI